MLNSTLFATFAPWAKKLVRSGDFTGGEIDFWGPRRPPYGVQPATTASLLFHKINTGSVLGVRDGLAPPPLHSISLVGNVSPEFPF